MRVSFFGKGGSGKTSLSAAFVKYLERHNKEVLAIDADINVNLGGCLAIEPKFLGDSFDEIANFLEPEVKNVSSFRKALEILRIKAAEKPLIGSTPPTNQSRFIQPTLDDEFIKNFTTSNGNKIALLTVGTYTGQKVGYDCYHSKLGSAVFIYNRLLDNENFFVVTDATAGIDSVGTSMFFVSDINIFVVEPTTKSIGVYKDFAEITDSYKLNTYVIGNKIRNENDMNFITSNIDQKNIIGFVPDVESLRAFEKGDKNGLDNFSLEIEELNKKVYDTLMNTPKNWEKYYQIVKQVYCDDAADWYSQYYGEDLTKYIDPNFKYEDIIKKNV